jgi:CSLREA domain-containing protein
MAPFGSGVPQRWQWLQITAVAAVFTLCATPIASAFDSMPYPGPNPPDGTATFPWKINLPEDFDKIGTDGTHLSNQHYLLTKDLNFENQDHRVRVDFNGTLDGGYHVISRIRVDQPTEDGVALFKRMNAGGLIRRLAITGSYFRGSRMVAPFAESMDAGSRVEECYSQGNEVIAAVSQSAGGIVGGAAYTSPPAVVRNCFARGNSVSCPSHQTVGGISGYHDARVECCYSAGNTLTAPRHVGGVIGYGSGSGTSYVAVIDSYSDATNTPSKHIGQLYSPGTWVNALVPDPYSSGFDITPYSIAQLNWDPAIWSKGPDNYPRLLGFNQEPVADAGADQVIQLGASAHLDGVGTTDDRTALQDLVFAWTIESAPAGSTASLSGADTPTPVLVPDRAGEFRIKLTVTDESGLPDVDETLVTATAVIANGSFEDGFAGWNAAGNMSIQSFPPYVPRDGSILVSFNDGDRLPNGVITQVLPTQPGQAYRLEFDVGVLAYNTNSQRMGVGVQGTASLVSDTITLTGLGGGRILWVSKSYTFTADSAATTLKFSDLSTTTKSIDLLLDNVRVTPLVTTLLVTSIPAQGVAVAVDPADTAGTGNGTTALRRFYNPGAVVDLNAPLEAVGGTFFNWLKDGAHYSTDPGIQVTMDGDHQMTAVYWSGDPMITVQPVSIEAVEGGIAVFSVTASGAVPLSYQWRFNGTDISGAEARELTISHVEAADAGNYDVVVSNSLGSLTSDTAVLSIQSGFVGLENGSFESDFQGWTVSENVWIQASRPYYATDGIKLAAFNGGNTTPNASLSQSFTTTPGQRYFLSFDMGVLSFNTSPQKIEVEVAGSPSLLLQTFLITGIADGKCHWVTQNLAFTADSPRTTLTFRDRSFPATSSIDLLLDHVMITPRVMRTLVVESSSPWDSIPVSVSPPDENGDADDSTRFSRKYIDGTHVDLVVPEMMTIGPFPYPFRTRTILFQHWLKDGAEIGTSPSTRIAMDGDHVLTAVYVLSPPIITAQPAGLSISVGGSATFRVGVTEQGPTTYQWRFNGTNIQEAVASAYTIPVVSWANAGTYDVVVTNAGGSTTSNVATLTVVSVSLVNGSFESGFDGWSHSGNVRVQTAAMVPDGSKVLGFNTGNSSVGGVVSQTFTTIPGLTYRLTFHMGVLDYNFSEQRLEVNVSGGVTLANRVFSMYGTGGGRTVWAVKTVDFTTDSAATTVKFTDRSPTSNGIDLLLDHVRLEPLLFTVTTLADENDGALGRGTGDSLREAIAAATASPGVELISFAPALDGGTIILGGTQLTVDTDVMIDDTSLGAGITISGNGDSRIFEVTAGRMVAMVGLTISGGGSYLVRGGGIYNTGNLSLKNVTVSGNSAYWASGGGIDNLGTLSLENSTVSGNSAVKSGNGSGGGGIHNSGSLRLVNSTISNNSCVGYGSGIGAGILNVGSVTVIHSTISGNFGCGVLENLPGSITLENSIIAGNAAIGGGAENLAGSGVDSIVWLGENMVSGDPMLAPLGDYGGRTQTMPPLAGSPTIDAAVWLGTTPGTDQRGFARPAGAAPDIGAVELAQAIVTTTTDENDGAPGLGTGDSLREAIAAATASPGAELIRFAPALDGGTITLGGTQLTVDTDVMIDASSLPAGITVSAAEHSRVFEVTAGRNVSMAGLSISGGYFFVTDGGGICNSGSLTLKDVTISGNSAFYAHGGGIFNVGTLSILDSTVSGNWAGKSSGGGGIHNAGSLCLVNSTVSDNFCDGYGSGGGILNDGTMTVIHSTVSGNRGNGVQVNNPGSLSLENSIIAGNTGDDGEPANLGGSGVSSIVELGRNIISGDPMLAPLGNHGGRTQTMPPMAGSPAIDTAIWLGSTPSTDQRGLPRPLGVAPDIGAVEISQLVVTTTADESDTGLGIGAGDSLREVLAAAGSGPGTKLVSFAPALNGGTITLGGTQFTVDTDVLIDAANLQAGITVSGNDLSRVFEVRSGRTVSMAGLTIARGGAWLVSGCGIFNSGTLTLRDVTIAGNHTLGDLVTYPKGAGVFNEGVFHMESCTATGNSVGNGSGGALYNNGVAVLINSTLSGNQAVYRGAGLLNDGKLTVRHCTISNNQDIYAGGSGIHNTGDLTLENSIVAGNQTSNPGVLNDLEGTVTSSLGANLIGGDPMLAPLGSYGGRTQTMPPLSGSPAIDAAVWLGTPPVIDQRGNPRPQVAPDIGAVEYVP